MNEANLNDISAFINCFWGSSSKKPRITKIEKKDFTIDIYIENATLASTSKSALDQYLGGERYQIISEEESPNIIVQISRVNVPEVSYDALDILPIVESNQSKGWFLGIGPFGPEYFPLENLTHACVFGSTGFGKSVFFKFLLSQTLAFHDDVVNFIIDPKKIDFKAFKNHPRVSLVANTATEWCSIISILATEMSIRESILKNSFTTPPTSLKEYNQFKAEHKRDDLPHLPRIICWIDEANVFKDDLESNMDTFYNLFKELLRRGRASGIHVIMAGQNISGMLGTASFSANVSTYFGFYLPHQCAGHAYTAIQHPNPKPIPGRLYAYNDFTQNWNESQVPYVASNDALAIAFGFSGEKARLENNGIVRLKFKDEEIRNWQMTNLCDSRTIFGPYNRRDNDRVFCYRDFYDISFMEENVPTTVASILRNKLKSKGDNSTLVLLKRTYKSLDPSNNTPEYKELVEGFKKKYKQSHVDFSYMIKDLRKNVGLCRIYEHLYGKGLSQIQVDPNLEEMVFPLFMKRKIDTYLSDVEIALRTNKKAPILILYGNKGFGKKTLLKAVSDFFKMPFRDVSESDMLSLETHVADFNEKFNELASPHHKNNDSAKKDSLDKTEFTKPKNEIIVFHQNDMRAIEHARLSAPNKLTVLFGEDKQTLFGNMSIAHEYKKISFPSCFLLFDEHMYKDDEDARNLITSILKKYKFDFSKGVSDIKEFYRANVQLIPSVVNNLIEKSQLRSILRGIVFNNDVLKQTLDDYKTEQVKNDKGVIIVSPDANLNDLIIHESTKNDLEDIIYKAQNLDSTDYKFISRIRKLGRLVALFTGPSGTGKSYAAEVIAKATNKELRICDFSSLMSKFVGESEKNFSLVFQEAQSADSILLLDEADAFLTNRGNEQDYERKIKNHLLSLMENYHGTLILTTNLAHDIDPAFNRRIDIKVEFLSPSEDMQCEILQRMLFPDAPLEKGVDLKKIVQGLSLTGGLIKIGLERAYFRMKKLGVSCFTQDLLRTTLVETLDEANLLKEKKMKRIGLN